MGCMRHIGTWLGVSMHTRLWCWLVMLHPMVTDICVIAILIRASAHVVGRMGLAHMIARGAHQEQEITFFCLGIGSDGIMQSSFAQIAEAGGGRYVPIDSVINLIDTILAIIMAEVER